MEPVFRFAKSLFRFIKNETVLIIAAVCAGISTIFVPPSEGYLHYIDWSVLVLLFCLMAIVEGFKVTGVFDWLTRRLLSRTTNAKYIALLLVVLCFFLSMLVTNDVALITIVPLTIGLFTGNPVNAGTCNSGSTGAGSSGTGKAVNTGKAASGSSGKGENRPVNYENRLIFIIVMETVAANLGSLVTPIGNPQNLYLFSVYHLDIYSFFSITLPVGAVGLVFTVLCTFCMKHETVGALTCGPANPDKARALVFLALFILCIFSVLRLVNYWLCLGIVLAVLLPANRNILSRIDYMLLLTFICFFVFVGNISRIEAINGFITEMLAGHEMIAAVLISQVISNVPAAVMLSSFTGNAKALIIGTNIGGLGTVVASLASLISFRFYCSGVNAKKGRYLATFSAVNFAFLAGMLIIVSGVFRATT